MVEKFYIDLTHPMTSSTPVFPGDPPFKIDKIKSIGKESSYTLCSLHLGNHFGTHIDFPAHVISEGKTSSDYVMEDLIGNGIIIEVPESKNKNKLGITEEFLEAQPIKENDIVFFKTQNSTFPLDKIIEEFVYLTPEGAKTLINKKVKMVGIDYLSIDQLQEEKLPTHHLLLEKDILIVENLNLKKISPGRYTMFVVPPRIPEMDGLPVRVFARR